MPRVPEVCTRVFCPHFSDLSGDTSKMGIAQTRNSANLIRGNGSSIKPPNPFQHETLWITIVASLLSILVSILKLAELMTGSSP